MKFLVTAALLCLALAALAAPEVQGPLDSEFKLGELAGIPDGLVVTHAPDTVEPTFTGPGGKEWLHRTAVTSEVGPVTIVQYGYFLQNDGHWYLAYGEEGFSGEDFAKRFGCPDATMRAGTTYTNEFTRSTPDRGPEQTARWYFIGVDAEGNRVKGEATVTLRGNPDGC